MNPSIRQPAVAGRFYPDDSQALVSVIDGFVQGSGGRHTAYGAVIPHAGYMYSGRVAGAVYAQLRIPSRVVILCPNHTGLGPALSMAPAGIWRTPLGDVSTDAEMSEALIECGSDIELDLRAHQYEHAIEVQLPFLQRLCEQPVKFVGIVVGTGSWEQLTTLGEAVAETINRIAPDALVIASSDMNHYESDAVTRVKDANAISDMLKLDAAGLYNTIQRERISMCGYGPAVVMLTAARLMGAQSAALVQYATSADVSGDFDRVVGYAGIIVS